MEVDLFEVGMTSIRRSLIFSGLALMLIGFGSIFILADKAMELTLQSRLTASMEAIQLRTDEQVKDCRDKFDQELLGHAQSIGRVMQFQYFYRFERESRKFQCGLVTQLLGAAGNGPLPATVWAASLAPTRRSPFGLISGPVIREYFLNLHLDELYLRHLDDDPGPEFIQLNTSQGIWRSPQLKGMTLPFTPEALDNGKLIEWHFDTQTIGEDLSIRRVILKTPLTLGWIRVPFPRASNVPTSELFLPLPRVFSRDRELLPSIYIQYARPLAELEQRIASIRETSTVQQQAIREDISRDRQQFRLKLGLIAGGAMLATLLGGPLLIRQSLLPLNRLSEAVSAVSERDFRLPMSAAELPQELVPIHTRLTQTLKALERAFEHEKQAVADLSHELRTPIAALLTTLDVALRKPRTPEQYQATLSECREITRQLSVLVERIMTLAWLDSGKDTPVREPVDFPELVQSCVALIRPLAEVKAISVTTECDPGVIVTSDSGKIREILMNLLHNAIEYNRPGGSVVVEVHAAPWGGATLIVKDTGIGMTPETQARVFERFFRADPSRNSSGAHAGIGLAIVQEYVNRLHGTIRIESTPDVGTSFILTFPADLQESSLPSSKDSPSQILRRRAEETNRQPLSRTAGNVPSSSSIGSGSAG
jgi:signal transduction histidine kinase